MPRLLTIAAVLTVLLVAVLLRSPGSSRLPGGQDVHPTNDKRTSHKSDHPSESIENEQTRQPSALASQRDGAQTANTFVSQFFGSDSNAALEAYAAAGVDLTSQPPPMPWAEIEPEFFEAARIKDGQRESGLEMFTAWPEAIDEAFLRSEFEYFGPASPALVDLIEVTASDYNAQIAALSEMFYDLLDEKVQSLRVGEGIVNRPYKSVLMPPQPRAAFAGTYSGGGWVVVYYVKHDDFPEKEELHSQIRALRNMRSASIREAINR